MVGGAPPFVEPAISAVLARHLADPPTPLPDAVPASLRAVIAGLLAKAPDDRPQNARAVRGALERILGTPVSGVAILPDVALVHTTVPGLPAAAAVSAVVTPRRSRLPIALAAVCALAVASIVVWRVAGDADRAPVADTPAHAPAAPVDAAIAHVELAVPPPDAAPVPAAPAAEAADAAVAPARPAKHVPAPQPLPPHPPPRPATTPAHHAGSGSAATSTPDLDFYHPR
jgi:hypothetical protein